MNVIEGKSYKCSNCGHTYLTYDLAEKCCKPKSCEDCGNPLPHKSYLRVCEECQEKRQYNNAEKLMPDEYNDKYSNNMVYYKDNYYCSIEDCLFDLCNQLSYEDFLKVKYIYGTIPYDIKLDFYHIVEYFEEEANIEDFQMDSKGYDELKEFIKQWNDKYGEVGYIADNIAIILSEDYMKEFWEDYHGYKDV